MEITEVRVRLSESRSKILRAFASVTFDNSFVVHGIRILEVARGLLVAMPSREVYDHCSDCGSKNSLRQNYCGGCGKLLEPAEPQSNFTDKDARNSLYKDICHPVNSVFRGILDKVILDQYEEEKVKGGDKP